MGKLTRIDVSVYQETFLKDMPVKEIPLPCGQVVETDERRYKELSMES